MNVVEISAARDLLIDVKRLGRSHASTLGFLPDGAFEEYAAKNQILLAVQGLSLRGYLLFRVSQNEIVSIAHLCVDPVHRGQGVAKALIERLAELMASCRGICLWCRRDFSVSRIWPSLGFVAVRSRPGRSAAGHELTYWWRDNGNPDLFAQIGSPTSTKIIAVMDANIVMDLAGGDHEESLGLLSDWLVGDVDLCTTPELTNEIERRKNPEERSKLRTYAGRYSLVKGTRQEYLAAEQQVRFIVPSDPSDSDISDMRQIAWAIAGDADVFVTRDEALLSKRDEIYLASGLTVSRPSELVSRVDALYREREYQPSRLAGTLLGLGQEANLDEGALWRALGNSSAGETKTQFLDCVRKLRSNPSNAKCLIVRDIEGNLVGLLGYAIVGSALRVHVIRAAKGRLKSSIERYLIVKAILIAAEQEAHICEAVDTQMSRSLEEVLRQARFLKYRDGWMKIVGPQLIKLQEVSHLVQRCADIQSTARDRLSEFAAQTRYAVQASDHLTLQSIEEAIWPARILDLKVPVFIVPIKPAWAQHLFDEALANEQLFGARADLALNSESVYYRSALNSGGLRGNARLLWYVSKDDGFAGSGALRAESWINEVVTGPVKELYGRFRRLGIYEWRDVIQIADGDSFGKAMAIRFSRTTLLRKPVAWRALLPAMRAHGVNSTLQSPLQISLEVYSVLKGMSS